MKKIFLLAIFSFFSLILSASDIYVVSVGISRYKEIKSLRLPEPDAKAIASLYKKKTKHVMLITGKYATKANIIKCLESQFSRAKKDDIVVFFFSGHGYPGGFCPYDMSNNPSSGLSYSEVTSILKQTKAKRKVVFADACFSGRIRSNDAHSTKYKEAEAILFLSSRGGETSIESPFMVNGYFTSFLIRGLRGGADANHNKAITAKEIFQFVSQKVKQKSNDEQHPVMWGHFDDNDILMDWR